MSDQKLFLRQHMTEKKICHHPHILPPQWEQPRPEPCEVTSCGCGKNWTCPVCFFGEGSLPCDCSAEISWELHNELLERSLVEHADIWKRLADE